jgi:tRNA(Ile)-lysidine synthase
MITNKVLRTVKESGLISKSDRILVGVSGGTDSTALLLILKALSNELKLHLIAAHMNHKMRGKESDADERFVKNLAKKLGIPFISESFDVPAFAKQNRLNLEDAARRIRYEFFDRAAAKVNANKIAVAHTADDNIETFLMRLVRGTGLKGLEGIPPVRGKIIRPLINILRTDLEVYLRSKKIKPRTDRSNFDTKYLRNSIRHQLIPNLKKYNNNIKEGLLRTIRSVNIDNELIEELSKKAFESLKKEKEAASVTIDAKAFMSLKPALRAGVIKLCIEHIKKDIEDISFINIMDIMDIAGKQRASLDIPGSHVEKKNGKLTFLASRPKGAVSREFLYKLEVPGMVKVKESGLEIESDIFDVKNVSYKKKDPFRAYLDRDKISGALVVRSRRRGDVFSPLGMKGKKKLQDIFIDEKIDIDDRDKIPVIEDGKKIVWIAGFRIANDVKIDSGTKKVVELSASRA